MIFESIWEVRQMQMYANRFNIAKNQDGSEVILNFFQNMPQFPDSVDQEAVVTDVPTEMMPVANLVMTSQCARSLLAVLQDILEPEDSPK